MGKKISVYQEKILRLAKNPTGRTGRNLPLAIITALILVATLVLSLCWKPEIFVLLVGAFSARASYEILRALKLVDINIPFYPFLLGAFLVSFSAFYGKEIGAFFALLLTIGFVCLARILREISSKTLDETQKSLFPKPEKKLRGEQSKVKSLALPARRVRRDVGAACFVSAYVLILPSYFVLLLHIPQGVGIVILAVLMGAGSDTGGWLFGVLMGKHPMAASISPKKTWEGFIGSIVGSLIVYLVATYFIHGLPVVFALVIVPLSVMAATIGDLGESLVKRDIGVKDIGSIFPGHGGVLDRMDSLIFVAPVFYVILSILHCAL